MAVSSSSSSSLSSSSSTSSISSSPSSPSACLSSPPSCPTLGSPRILSMLKFWPLFPLRTDSVFLQSTSAGNMSHQPGPSSMSEFVKVLEVPAQRPPEEDSSWERGNISEAVPHPSAQTAYPFLATDSICMTQK